jgi:hypothetical protein
VNTLTLLNWTRIRVDWLAFIMMAMHTTEFPEQKNNSHRFKEHSTDLPCRRSVSWDISHKVRNNLKIGTTNFQN